jgi:hypothetical protein
MKSPWNLFSKLTSRRQPQLANGAAVEVAREPKSAKKATLRVQLIIANARPAPALDEIPQNDPLETTAVPVGNPVESKPVVLPTVEEVQEIPVLENQPSSDKTVASVDQVLNPTRSPRTKYGNIAEKAEPAAVPRIEVAPNDDDRAATPTLVAKPASQAVTLDDEIKELRQQLAKRLHMQNDQLRKMIERFDR